MRKVLDLGKAKRMSTESLMKLAEFVLKNYIFEYNLSFQKQLRGTKIGTKMVLPCAIIFLGDLQERFFSDCDISSLVWWRYIDDIFMLCQHGEKKLKQFSEIPNSYHPIIKITANYSREKIGFLDAEVIKKGNQLLNVLYIKPTDTHQYLHAISCHVFHSKKSIPYGQALRLNRICIENSFVSETNFQSQENFKSGTIQQSKKKIK